MTADEPTAIRHPKRGKAHRPVYLAVPDSSACFGRILLTRKEAVACDQWTPASLKGLTERVPLSSVPTTDLCRTCWPTTKGVTP